MTKEAYKVMMREKREDKSRGRRRGKLIGILKQAQQATKDQLKAIWRGGSDDSSRWLRGP